MDLDKHITEYKIKFDNLFLNSTNITGIPIIRKENFHPRPFLDIQSEDKKIYRPKNYVTLNTFSNVNKNYSTNQKEVKIDTKKLMNIKNLLSQPAYKNPFDYLSIKRKKCTIKYLIQKISQKENLVDFSENKLCNKNFPLLRVISNRKSFNNSKRLMIDLMTAEYGDLTKEQLNTIKYSEYKKTSILKPKKKKIIKRPNSLQNVFIEKSRNNILEKKLNLLNHNTNRSNFDILTNIIKKNCFLDIKGQNKNNLNKDKICEILKDVSHLKSNQRIMPLNFRMKTI